MSKSSSSSSGDSSSDEDEQVNNDNDAVSFQTLKNQTQKHQKPQVPPPSSSSSGESEGEEEGEDGEEEGEDGEETDDAEKAAAGSGAANPTQPKPASFDEESSEEGRGSKPAKPTGSKPASSSEDDESSDEEGGSKPVKPTESKPASESGSDSESEPAELATPVSSKPIQSPDGKPYFQRLWSLADEIAVLRSLVKYKEKHGSFKASAAIVKDIHSSVAKSLTLKVSETQLSSKIQTLKKKYLTKAKKGKDGKVLKFASPHDEAVYELSEKVWGDTVVEDSDARGKPTEKANGKGKSKEKAHGKTNGKEVRAKEEEKQCLMVKGEEKNLKRKFMLFEETADVMGNKLLKEAVVRSDPDEVSAMEKSLKKVRALEVRHNMRKLELLQKSFELVAEGFKRSNA